jgi:hypothetical protein
MAARLGNVIYWAACAVAAFAVAWIAANAWVLWVSGSTAPGENMTHIVNSTMIAVCAWLAGRATRYVLAGR